MSDINTTGNLPCILLASGSPRRADTLERLGIPYRVVPPKIHENTEGIPPREAVIQLAENKARAVIPDAQAAALRWILAADTLIDLDGVAVGKPRDREDARRILRAFSGRSHAVLTGLCLMDLKTERRQVIDVMTRVDFAGLSDQDINWYLSTGEWRDAAGAYKIQEKGACLVTGINGSYSNVVGLPIRVFYGMLSALNYPYCVTQ